MSADIRRLRATVADLLALSTLPETWVGGEPPAIAAELADLLVESLQMDFAFVRLCDPEGRQAIEVMRGDSWKAFPEWLEQRLAVLGHISRKELVTGVDGGDESCRGIVIPIGVNGERGLIAAACDRADFPDQIDQLLLSAAANNAAIAFRNARLINELRCVQAALVGSEQALRKARDELEIKVAERTAELLRSEAYLAEGQRLTRTGSWAGNVLTKEVFHSSEEHSRLYGFDPDRASPSFEELHQRIHPDDRARIDQAFETARRAVTDVDVHYRIVLPDGTIKRLHSVAHPAIDESGDVAEVVGTVMDVTEQWNARAELEKAFEEIKDLQERLQRENIALREEVDQASMFEEIVGASPALTAVLSRVSKVANSNLTVLITMTGNDRAIELAGGTLGRQRHVCAFFNNIDEEHRVLRSFIRDAFDRGEKVTHLVNPGTRDQHLKRFTEAGIDVREMMDTGQLEVPPWTDIYVRDHQFDQDSMLASVEKLLQSGAAAGYELTRLVGHHMDWVFRERPATNNLVEYEARLNHVLSKYNDPVICTYDLSKFGASVAMDIMRTHPLVIIGGLLRENPFFVPPDQFLDEMRERRSARKATASGTARAPVDR